MLEAIILGSIQGMSEWLPVSSEGMLVLVQTQLFGATELKNTIELALFLHLGTFLAALVYFRKEALNIMKTIINYRDADQESKSLFVFLFWATIISGIVGYGLLEFMSNIEDQFLTGARIIMALVGAMLLVTGFLQIKAQERGARSTADIKPRDAQILGVVQGFAAIPGLSRSGLTVAALLMSGFREDTSLRLSFLASLPIVLGGNIILNFTGFEYSLETLVSLVFAFGFGLLTIGLLLKLARKAGFGYFIISFGVLSIIAALI
jgi:undecaprenyl-diphosphatase